MKTRNSGAKYDTPHPYDIGGTALFPLLVLASNLAAAMRQRRLVLVRVLTKQWQSMLARRRWFAKAMRTAN